MVGATTPERAPTSTSPTRKGKDANEYAPPRLDERQLDLIRALLRMHFPSSETIDTFDAERSAQRFIVDPNGPDRHTLIAMRDALDHPDLELLLDERLIDALRLAGESRVTLTAQGPRTSTEWTPRRSGMNAWQVVPGLGVLVVLVSALADVFRIGGELGFGYIQGEAVFMGSPS